MPDEQLITARLEIEALDGENDDELMCLAACHRRAAYSFFVGRQGPEWPHDRVTFLCTTHARAFLDSLREKERALERFRDLTS